MALGLGSYNGITFELGIRNTQAVAANFHRADAQIGRDMRRVVDRNLDVFDTVWSALIPVDTTRMLRRRRIVRTHGGLGFEAGWDATDFVGEGLAFYPFFQEFGTYKMRAQPSLGPAYRYIAAHFSADVSSTLRGSIGRIGKY